ncbi:MAG: MFS transporter [Porticoccaceae bacterium]|nr:MAG: MFS transporter [Porticoccaceae bacterium]
MSGWRQALAVYASPRVAAMLPLGFAAGLPLLLVFGTLSAWLARLGVEKSAIGFFSWVGLAYSLKFLWAPLLDRFAPPLFGRWLGRRRGWLLLAQLGVAAGLWAIAQWRPEDGLWHLALLAFWVAFWSATQDAVVDALRIDSAPEALQGAMAANYQLGYRLGMIAAGAGALWIAGTYSWPGAYRAMALAMAVGLATTLAVGEPAPAARPARRFSLAALAEPFAEFFARHGRRAAALLALVALYRFSDVLLGIMANPFYIDLGFDEVQIAQVTKLYGLALTVLGAYAGGAAVVRWGVAWPLVLGALLGPGTNLLFAWLALRGPDLGALVAVVSADNFTAGFAGSALIAYASSLVNRAFSATQYAVMSSLFTLGGKFVGGFSGLVVDGFGYPAFFLCTALLGLPGLLLAIRLAPATRRGGG